MARCERILTLSNEDHAMLVSLGIADDKIQDIDPLFEVPPRYDRSRARSELEIDEGTFVVLWVGRFEEEKDPLTFVRAIALSDAPSIVAIMAGNGTLDAALRGHAALTGKRFLFPGWIGDMARFYSAADVFVSTSKWEAAPLAPFEAAGSGLPLVVSAAPGNERFISSGMAVGFSPGDATQLASLIKELHDDPEERAERAARSAGGVRSIPLHETPELLESIYKELVRR
jgi:glycosyltransferase involved in cell wall biosynthesis